MQYRIAKQLDGEYVIQALCVDIWVNWPVFFGSRFYSYQEAKNGFELYQQKKVQQSIDEEVVETFEL